MHVVTLPFAIEAQAALRLGPPQAMTPLFMYVLLALIAAWVEKGQHAPEKTLTKSANAGL